MSEANYNKTSCLTRRLSYPFSPDTKLEVGDFCWGEERDGGVRYLYIKLPGGENREGADAVRCCRNGSPGGTEGNYTWNWDGNEERPTLNPSLHWRGRWHGFLRNGRLQSCP